MYCYFYSNNGEAVSLVCGFCRIVAHKLIPTTTILSCKYNYNNFLSFQGNCITTAYPSDVCRLNSFASRCDSSSATNCSCYSGYENVDEKNCKGILLI